MNAVNLFVKKIKNTGETILPYIGVILIVILLVIGPGVLWDTARDKLFPKPPLSEEDKKAMDQMFLESMRQSEDDLQNKLEAEKKSNDCTREAVKNGEHVLDVVTSGKCSELRP